MPLRPRRFTPVRNLPVDESCMLALRALLVLAVPISIASIGLSCLFAWIQAREYSYTTQDWQRCLTAPNTGSTMKGGKQSFTPDTQMFAGSVAAMAGRAFVFLILAFKAVYMGVKDHDMLPYSVWVSFFALAGQTFYREGSPVQPEPKEMSATLITLVSFVRQDMYDGLPWGQGICETALHLNRAFLAIQFFKVAVTSLVFMVALYAAAKSPRQFAPTLTGSYASLAVVIMTVLGYLLTLIAKETVAQDTLYVLRHQEKSLANIFPFKKADMDILSGTMMLACGTVLIGVYHECTEKFKLSAAVSILHVSLVLPILVGTFAAYSEVSFPFGKGKSYSMWDQNECMAYISSKNSNPENLFKGFDVQLQSICRQAQVSLIGQFIITVSLVLQAVVSLYVIWANRAFKRPLRFTRCRTCVDRREDQGSILDLSYEPTIASPFWQSGHHHHHHRCSSSRPGMMMHHDDDEDDNHDDDAFHTTSASTTTAISMSNNKDDTSVLFEPLLPEEALYKSTTEETTTTTSTGGGGGGSRRKAGSATAGGAGLTVTTRDDSYP